MRHVVACLFVLSSILAPLTSSSATAAPNCQYVLGFATLHDLIPNIVGNCFENEQHNPTTGNGTQATTNGLLFWRKADNFTAFTNGYRTWINGPFGLQVRLNTERFPWEVLTPNDLKNATYTVPDIPVPVVKLTDGTFTVSTGPGASNRVTATLEDQSIAIGDLNGDGGQYGAGVLSVNTGGTGEFKYLALVIKENGMVKNVATTFLGDRVKIQNVAIGLGTITVKLITFGPNDPLCCPTVPATQTYQLQNGKLVKTS